MMKQVAPDFARPNRGRVHQRFFSSLHPQKTSHGESSYMRNFHGLVRIARCENRGVVCGRRPIRYRVIQLERLRKINRIDGREENFPTEVVCSLSAKLGPADRAIDRPLSVLFGLICWSCPCSIAGNSIRSAARMSGRRGRSGRSWRHPASRRVQVNLM